MSELDIITVDNQLVVDSRLIAQQLEVDHTNTFLKTIRKYQSDFESLGVLVFKTQKPSEGSPGGRPETFCYLNENQATYAMTLSRNSEKVRKCKLDLVKSFDKAKQLLKEKERPAPVPPRLTPVYSSIEYLNGLKELRSMPRDKITQLIEYQMISELEHINVNQRLLTGQPDTQVHITTANVRAKQLGYTDTQISDGTSLGRFVKKYVKPFSKEWQGQYQVWHYAVNDELDKVIHSFFQRDRGLFS